MKSNEFTKGYAAWRPLYSSQCWCNSKFIRFFFFCFCFLRNNWLSSASAVFDCWCSTIGAHGLWARRPFEVWAAAWIIISTNASIPAFAKSATGRVVNIGALSHKCEALSFFSVPSIVSSDDSGALFNDLSLYVLLENLTVFTTREVNLTLNFCFPWSLNRLNCLDLSCFNKLAEALDGSGP